MLNKSLLHTALVLGVLVVGPGALASEPPPGASPIQVALAGPPTIHREMLAEIAAWISRNFGMPASGSLPRVEIVSPQRFIAVRYRGFRGGLQADAQSAPDDLRLAEYMRDVVALYEDSSQTIYLREGWSGTTPADVSLLVHEMVHHLQNVAGLKYECPQAREKAAYAAQREWLAAFGRDFFAEFETDPVTLMLRTTCGL